MLGRSGRRDFGLGAKPTVEGPLAELLEECLAFEPSKRPASMEQVRDRLVEQSLLPARGRRYVKKHLLRSRFAGLALVVTIVFAAVGAYVRPPYAERLVTQAVAARETGEYQASIELLNKALNADSDIPGARLERARCYLKMKDYVLDRGDLMHLVKELYSSLAPRDPKYHSKAYTCLRQAVELRSGPTYQLLSGKFLAVYREQPSFHALLETAKITMVLVLRSPQLQSVASWASLLASLKSDPGAGRAERGFAAWCRLPFSRMTPIS